MIKPENYFRTLDPRIDFDEEPLYSITDAANQINYPEYPASTFDNNRIDISLNNSRDVAIARKMFMRVGFIVTITGTPAIGERLYQQELDAPRFMPFNSCVNTVQVKINGETFTDNTKEYLSALMRYNNLQEEYGYTFSGAPSFMDSYQKYSDFTRYGSSLNALGNIGECSKDSEPRGGFPVEVLNDPATGMLSNQINGQIAVLRFVTYEPIFVSPLLWGKLNQKGLLNVDSLQVQFTLDGTLTRCWSRDEQSRGTMISPTVMNVVMDTNNKPTLCLTTMTPKFTQIQRPMQIYPFSDVEYYPQTLGNIDAGKTLDTTFNNISLRGCPTRVYIFARRRNMDATFATTDTYARLDYISMTFDNNNGIFAPCSAQALHQISLNNGSRQSWSDWSKYQGSVFCIDFGRDVPLQEGVAPGVSKNIQMQFNARFTNVNDTQAINFDLYTVVVYEGIFVIEREGAVQKISTILSKEQVVGSKQIQRIPYNQVNYLEGAGFMDSVKKVTNGIAKAYGVGKKVYDKIPASVKNDALKFAKGSLETLSPRLAAVVEDIGPVALDVAKSLLGKGYTEQQVYVTLSSMKGGALLGGKKLTKKSAKKLMY